MITVNHALFKLVIFNLVSKKSIFLLNSLKLGTNCFQIVSLIIARLRQNSQSIICLSHKF